MRIHARVAGSMRVHTSLLVPLSLLVSLSMVAAVGCAAPLLEASRGFGEQGPNGPAAASETCDTPVGTSPFSTAAAEDVAIDRSALGAAVQYATDRGAQSVRIYRHGCLIARGGHDPFTENQRLPAWSMTKGVVSTAVGRAVALGLLDVDDPIGDHIGGLRGEVAALTVRRFLTQTSGLRMAWVNDLWAAGIADSVADVLDRPFQAEPGSTFLYAQTAVTVLVAVVETASGSDFQDFVRRELFGPIGITDSQWAWQRDGSGRTQGFAFLEMAPVAWARLGHLLLRRGSWNGTQLIDADYMSEAVTGTAANPGYGFLWWTNSGDWHHERRIPRVSASRPRAVARAAARRVRVLRVVRPGRDRDPEPRHGRGPDGAATGALRRPPG